MTQTKALPGKPPSTDLTSLRTRLESLGLPFAAESLPELLTQAAKEDLGAPSFLEVLLESERSRREERRVRTALRAARADQTLERRMLRFTSPDLVLVDDLGLRPLQEDEPIDLYEVIRQRYERGSMVITSNRAVEEWYPLFLDDLMASAAMDRLLHHAHVVVMEGRSYLARDRKPSAGGGGRSSGRQDGRTRPAQCPATCEPAPTWRMASLGRTGVALAGRALTCAVGDGLSRGMGRTRARPWKGSPPMN